MVKALITFSIMFAFGINAQHQMKTGYIYSKRNFVYRSTGTFSGAITYAPGLLLNSNQTNYYAHGLGAYHFNRSVSVQSDTYWFLNSPNENSEDLQILRSNFGLFYHFNNTPTGNWDVKLGMLPGITWYKNEESYGSKLLRMSGLSPSLNFVVGYDYYVWDYFHFFAQVAYTHTTIRGLPVRSKRLDALLFSVGLGFQIQTKGWFKGFE